MYTTRNYCLEHTTSAPISLIVFSAANSVLFEDLPYFIGGYGTQLAGSTIARSLKKIKSTICLSSTEAEYISASNAVGGIEWVNMFKFMMLNPILVALLVALLVDNQPASKLHSIFHPRTKNIALHYHKIRDMVEKKLVNIEYDPMIGK